MTKTEKHDKIHLWLHKPENQVKLAEYAINDTELPHEHSTPIDIVIISKVQDSSQRMAVHPNEKSSIKPFEPWWERLRNEWYHKEKYYDNIVRFLKGDQSAIQIFPQAIQKLNEIQYKKHFVWNSATSHSEDKMIEKKDWEKFDEITKEDYDLFYRLAYHYWIKNILQRDINLKHGDGIYTIDKTLGIHPDLQKAEYIMNTVEREKPIYNQTRAQYILDCILTVDVKYTRSLTIEKDSKWIWKDFDIRSKRYTVLCEFKPDLTSVSGLMGQIHKYIDRLLDLRGYREYPVCPIVLTFDPNTEYDAMLAEEGIKVYRTPLVTAPSPSINQLTLSPN